MANVFTGSGKHFQELQAVALDDSGLGEIVSRMKLQPHFLGEPLIVIAEGDNFPFKKIPGVEEILALDVLGRSVTIILVLGIADVGDGVDSRAMELAAMAGDISADELGRITREFLKIPRNDIQRRSWDDLGIEIDDESVELSSLLAATFKRDAGDYSGMINKEQRIIIAAEGFSRRLVNVVNWLVESGVNIKGLRYQKYLVGGQEVFFAEQVIPRKDPSIDGQEDENKKANAIDPWRAKGKAYYLELLSPSIAIILEEMMISAKKEIFSVNYIHKYYFWMRGAKRTFRIRTYHRDRLEVGFHNATVEVVEEFMTNFKLPGVEIYTIGGYADSTFVAITSDVNFNDEWKLMIKSWLSGKC